MKLGVIGNPRYPQTRDVLARLEKRASDLDLDIRVEPALSEACDCPPFGPDGPDADLDLLLTLGGDGTLLRGARAIGEAGTPIMGVNLGRVGFLNTTVPAELPDALRRFAHGEFRLEDRQVLDGRVLGADGELRVRGRALNDVVVHKAGVARVVQLQVWIDDDQIGQYSSDGIIVATPVGSTAYSLSAGGPLVVPGVDALVITAICPHTLAVRPIVVSGSSTIRLVHVPPFIDDVLVSYDGQEAMSVERGGAVIVRKADIPVRLVRVGEEGFFQRVRRKLQWGDLSDREGA